MEQHPVPQNVTGFQFKLIGDITLKQFGYIAGGLIIAYFSTKFFLIPSLLRWPVAGLWALLGFGLAFVPIEERPLDRWLIAFFKSIYAPTQYVWKKHNQAPLILLEPTVQPAVVPPPIAPAPPKSPVVEQIVPEFKATLPEKSPPVQLKKPAPPPPPPPPQPMPPVKKPPARPADRWTMGAPPVKSKAVTNVPPAPSPVTGKRIIFEEKPAVTTVVVAPSKNTEKIKSQYQAVTDKLNAQLALMQKEVEQGSVAKNRFLELQQTLTQLINEKERLNQELISLKQKLTDQQKISTVTPTQYTSTPSDTRQTVKMVSPSSATKMGMPSLTTQPNVITGIIKDSKGNLLPNLIVTVKDKESIPVRALKTNKLGQFAASTPLSNAVYFIEIEDPKKMFQFNRIEVTLTGQILPPLEVSAISEKDIVRQKLTQELFGKNTI